MKARGLGAWARRLFASKAGSEGGLPPPLPELLASAPALRLATLPGYGGALVAARDIRQGEVVLREAPFVAVPSVGGRGTACYHCLSSFGPHGGGRVLPAPDVARSRRIAFCSERCAAAARRAYFALEEAAGARLAPLDSHCRRHGERFPLMAARLALSICQRAWLGGDAGSDGGGGGGGGEAAAAAAGAAAAAAADGAAAGNGGGGALHKVSSSTAGGLASSSWMSGGGGGGGDGAAGAGAGAPAGARGRDSLAAISHLTAGSFASSSGCSRLSSSAAAAPQRYGKQAPPLSAGGALAAAGDPVSAALGFLTYANVPLPPPGPWRESHALLVDALAATAAALGDDGDERAEALAELLAGGALGEVWWAAVLARLHINTVRCDIVDAGLWDLGPEAAAAAVAAAAEDGGGGGGGGSALYLLASKLNHSCEPPLSVSWPRGDATACFRAERDVGAGEQLFIAYCDAQLPVDERREFLRFAYGFACACDKCAEEAAEAAAAAPPELPGGRDG